MTIETMTLERTFHHGEGTLVVDQDHPLVSVFRRAAKTGKYTGHWLQLIVRPSPNERPRLLGTVVWTPGERFLFFPGKPEKIRSTPTDGSLTGLPIDHFTLELDDSMSRFNEHISALDSMNSRGHRRRGKVVEGQLHPWFSIVEYTLDDYEKIPAKLITKMDFPRADITRRCQAVWDKATQTDTHFPEIAIDSQHYYQLDVWAGRGEDWKIRYADVLPWVNVDDVVSGYLREPVVRVAQSHEFEVNCGIIVVLTRPSGLPKNESFLYGLSYNFNDKP